MATITLTSEEYEALVAERNTLRGERDGLSGEVRTLKVKVSLLEERLKAHLRQLFDAKSEVRGSEQKDLFFNEAEALAPSGTPVAEEHYRRGIGFPDAACLYRLNMIRACSRWYGLADDVVKWPRATRLTFPSRLKNWPCSLASCRMNAEISSAYVFQMSFDRRLTPLHCFRGLFSSGGAGWWFSGSTSWLLNDHDRSS